jgi:hypothetical protein
MQEIFLESPELSRALAHLLLALAMELKGVDYLLMAKLVEHLITRRSALTVLSSSMFWPVFW